MKTVLLVLSLSFGVAHADPNVQKLMATDWVAIENVANIEIQKTLSFKTPGKVNINATCFFSRKGLGRDLSVDASADIELGGGAIRYLNTADRTVNDGETGN